MSTRLFLLANLSASAVVVGFLVWLIYFRTAGESAGMSLGFLPAVNACLNGLSAVFLTRGWFAIRAGRRELHRACMKLAFLFSALFLASYLVYHAYHGDTPFPGRGWIRPLYFSVLISHILLSVAVLPLVFSSFFFALTGRLGSHRRISRFTLPVWLYVSVTGVAVFGLLRLYS